MTLSLCSWIMGFEHWLDGVNLAHENPLRDLGDMEQTQPPRLKPLTFSCNLDLELARCLIGSAHCLDDVNIGPKFHEILQDY